MAAQLKFQEIPLTAVDLKDHTFVIFPLQNLDRLMASLKEVGLLSPPWVRRLPGGERWQAVTGGKRLAAVAALGWERLPAITLPAATPDSRCLLINLYDNACSRGFNLREQAHLASRLLNYWDRRTVVADFLPLLGLPSSPHLLEKLMAVSSLEAPLQAMASQGRLSLEAGALLARWDPRDRTALLPFLAEFPLTHSKQKEFLEGLDLLAWREAANPGDILGRPEFQKILGDKQDTAQERAAALRSLLQGCLSPRLMAAGQAFARALQRLGLSRHPRLNLKPPPAFEGPDFHLEIKFKDAPELDKLLKELARLVPKEEFTELTNI